MAGSSIFLTFHDTEELGQVNEVRIPCNGFNFDKSTYGAVYPNINIQRDLDGMSATLFRAATTGLGFAWGEIEIDKAGADGRPVPWNTITIEKGEFVSDNVVGRAVGSKSEILVLSFAALQFDNVHDANGQTTPPDEQGWYNVGS
ncbi:MAG: hypothetical protein WBE72_08435 [Terracidiphilus sp.]